MKLDDARLYIEHGFLCLREEGGWLIWSQKISADDGRDLLPQIREAVKRHTPDKELEEDDTAKT